MLKLFTQFETPPEPTTDRLVFATPAMHAYAHAWSCQLAFNTRFQEGMGLTDGEGDERHWAKIRHLIGPTRSCGTGMFDCLQKFTEISMTIRKRSKRIWYIDRKAKAVNNTQIRDLGGWLARKLKEGIYKKGIASDHELKECGVEIQELNKHWTDQKTAQMSIRACEMRILPLIFHFNRGHLYQIRLRSLTRMSMRLWS